MRLTKGDIWRRVAGLLILVIDAGEPEDGRGDPIQLLLDDLSRLELHDPVADSGHVQAAEALAVEAEQRITMLVGAFTAAFVCLAHVHDEEHPGISSLDAVRAMALGWADMDS